jgi:hypothetical protein
MKTDYDDGSVSVSFALANPAIIEYNSPEPRAQSPEPRAITVP